MNLECSECLVVLRAERVPFICPSCGVAGAIFCEVDDEDVELAEDLIGMDPAYGDERLSGGPVGKLASSGDFIRWERRPGDGHR